MRCLRRPEMKMFDFCVRQRGDSFDAIFARVWLGGGARACVKPDCGGAGHGTHRASSRTGAQPTSDHDGGRSRLALGPMEAIVSIRSTKLEPAHLYSSTGLIERSDPGPFPFAFTVGCLEIDLPADLFPNTSADIR